MLVLVTVCGVCVYLSSWDEYAAEVKSGRLEWSPVHRSDKFWVNLHKIVALTTTPYLLSQYVMVYCAVAQLVEVCLCLCLV